jgi:transcriptional regulator with XRE-family HTH domain
MNTSTYITDIKQRAAAAGFNMAEVSREAGLDQAQVSRWISGKTVPLVSSVDKLKQALDRLIATRIDTLTKDAA